jgi:NCAIR mutase (PurE)-related proteins
MREDFLKQILKDVKEGSMSEEAAFEQLKELPYKEMGFANLDNHRQIRTGFPEVVYCEGKTPGQIGEIFEALSQHGTVMGTRATKRDFAAVQEKLPQAVFHEAARIIVCKGNTDSGTLTQPEKLGRVAVVSAGTADIPVAEEAAVTAETLGNDVVRVYDVGVSGIHRLFDKLEIIRSADVVVCVAGMEGALASVIGGLVEAPVIAVPTSVGYGANFGGLSALLSMLNSCANGVSIVNIDNGFGAGYTASVINKKR